MKTISYVSTLLLALAFVVGCSGKIATQAVTGKVTMDGAPVAKANVTFHPKEAGQGSPAYAITDDQGVYVLQTALGAAGAGTTEGEYIVTVAKVESIDTGKTKSIGPGTEVAVYESKTIIPEVYGDRETSPFTFTVQGGKNTFDIETSSSGN